MSDYCVAGVDLGGTKIYTVLAGSKGEVLAEIKMPTEAAKGPEHVIARILESVERVKGEAPPSCRLRSLALGAPGPLDTSRGIIHFAPNLYWHSLPVGEILEKRTGVPVRLDNDANLAALGEYVYGAGRGASDMIFITISTGVGGGLILGGKLYRGAADGAGEIGHMTLLPDGPRCGCGNRGCLEALSSGTAIAREAGKLVAGGGGKGILAAAGGDPGAIDAAVVACAAAEGDPGAISIMEEAARYLGIGIANLVNLLNPSLVVLGGGVMAAGDIIWAGVRREIRARSLEAAWSRLRLAPAGLGDRAGAMGAVALALGTVDPLE